MRVDVFQIPGCDSVGGGDGDDVDGDGWGGSQGGNEKKVWNGMRLGGFMMVLWRGNGLDCCRARSVHCTSSIMADGLFLSRALTVGEDVGAPSPVQLSASKVLGPRKGCTDHKPP